MKYDEALEAWGALKLKELRSDSIKGREFMSVLVSMDFSEGYACCGGRNPECYCSLAESPKAEVNITGTFDETDKYGYYDRVYCTIEMADFDFSTVLREICEAAGGTVNA